MNGSARHMLLPLHEEPKAAKSALCRVLRSLRQLEAELDVHANQVRRRGREAPTDEDEDKAVAEEVRERFGAVSTPRDVEGGLNTHENQCVLELADKACFIPYPSIY